MSDLTPERLREIEARCEAATPGPWSVPHGVRKDSGCDCPYFLCEDLAGSVATISIDNGKPVGKGGNDSPPLEQARANAHLVANCRQDIPDLIAALRQVSEERDQMAAAVAEARKRFQRIQNCKRPPAITQEHFIFCLQENASLALVNVADPAECLKARDAEIRHNVMREMGSKGGVKGAATLNAKLTPEERKASASKAAKSRWADSARGKR